MDDTITVLRNPQNPGLSVKAPIAFWGAPPVSGFHVESIGSSRVEALALKRGGSKVGFRV